MRKTTFAVLILLIAGTAAASKMEARVGYDQNTDFSEIKTFTYIDSLDTSVVDSAPPVHEMIKLLIIRQLQDSGMKWIDEDENPDVFVTYHTDASQELKMNVTLYKYHYSTGWWWSPLWGSGMDLSSFSQASLVIDIWRPATEELIWRGAVVGVIPDDPSPAKAQKIIEKALDLMGKEFRKMRKKAGKG
jgi:hypothetical protein